MYNVANLHSDRCKFKFHSASRSAIRQNQFKHMTVLPSQWRILSYLMILIATLKSTYLLVNVKRALSQFCTTGIVKFTINLRIYIYKGVCLGPGASVKPNINQSSICLVAPESNLLLTSSSAKSQEPFNNSLC